MSDPVSSPVPGEPQEGLFLEMIAQLTNMALIFLGHLPHPQTGKHIVEIETARVFIDQLEMLQAKTRGNLSSRESSLLKQSLMATRMAFVEAVESPGKEGDKAPAAGEGDKAKPDSHAPGEQAPPASQAEAETTPPKADDPGDERKKFVKKY
jgi:hypothetical protein